MSENKSAYLLEKNCFLSTVSIMEVLYSSKVIIICNYLFHFQLIKLKKDLKTHHPCITECTEAWMFEHLIKKAYQFWLLLIPLVNKNSPLALEQKCQALKLGGVRLSINLLSYFWRAFLNSDLKRSKEVWFVIENNIINTKWSKESKQNSR